MTDLATINELFPSSSNGAVRATNSVEELGSDAFLELMVAQLENQDPTKPLENSDFIGQLAQFGTVSGVQELNEGFSGLSASLSASQGWQAASLVGRSVVTDGNVGELQPRLNAAGELELGLEATVDFQGSSSGGTVFVQDLSGRLLYSAPLPAGVTGDLRIQWDGLDSSGEPVAPGSYRVSAESQVNGQSTALPVYAHQRVDSVAVDSSTGLVTLNLGSGNKVSISDVKQFL